MSDEDEPTVRITLKTIWEQQQAMAEKVNSLADLLPQHIRQTDEDLDEVNRKVADHETRLRKVEQRIWMGVGIVGFIVAGLQVFASVWGN